MPRKSGGKQAAAGEGWTAVRLPLAVLEDLKEQAAAQERSVSWILRKIILEARGYDESGTKK